MIRVLIVDDHAFMRESIGLQLSKLDQEIEVTGAENAKSAIKALKSQTRFDVVLLDLALPDMDGLACLSKIKSMQTVGHIAILSAYDDSTTICRAKAGGASGFISKRLSIEELLTAITSLTKGEEFWSQPLSTETSFSTAEVHRVSPPIVGKGLSASKYGLTERHMDLLGLLNIGYSNREIADHLGIGEGTVKSHFNAIFKALGVSSRSQALAAMKHYKIRLSEK